MWFKTSWDSATSNSSSANGNDSASPRRTSAPGTALATRLDEARRGIDGGDTPSADDVSEHAGQRTGAAPDIERSMIGLYASDSDVPCGELGSVPPDMSVVDLSRDVEGHGVCSHS